MRKTSLVILLKMMKQYTIQSCYLEFFRKYFFWGSTVKYFLTKWGSTVLDEGLKTVTSLSMSCSFISSDLLTEVKQHWTYLPLGWVTS